MKTFNYILLLAFAASIGFSSCEKDPQVPNEEELITTFIYTLTPQAGGNPVIFSFRDLDGAGGLDPVVVQGRLNTHSVYNGVVQLLNESVTPTVDITAEVAAEASDHQFFYTFPDSSISYVYTDVDDDNNPIGITTMVTTGDISDGLMTVLLRHLPDKFAAGVKSGNVSNAGGETDIEVSFFLEVE